ncbi:cytochrome P450 [Streptomyces sp. NPDC057702]|uniref:cytochrome P450 n=1 Tax=unclassified Streptomyces TaxID=2593676 RepID=UPI0036C6DAAD
MDQRTDLTAAGDVMDLPLPRPRECPFGPSPDFARLRIEAPVVQVKCPTGMRAWLVSRYADVREVLGDAERFSSRTGQVPHMMGHADPQRPVLPGEFTRMDGAEYQRFRRHLAPEVGTPKRLTELRPRVEAIVDERIDALAAAGGRADFYGDFTVPVTTAAISGVVGVPYADRHLFHAAAGAVFSDVTSEAEMAAAMRPLHEYLYQLVRARRADPRDDGVSRIIARSEQGDEPFTEAELVSMCAVTLVAGFDTTATALAHGMFALLAHREQYARLRADPALIPGAVEEIVRCFGGAAGIARQVTRDTEIGGTPVRGGDYVVVAIQAADRDPEEFDDPDAIDVGRRMNGHLGFGYGTHQCFGQQTARLELTVVLEKLVQRIPSLRLACEVSEVPFKSHTPVIGPAAVPVTWDEIAPRAREAHR